MLKEDFRELAERSARITLAIVEVTKNAEPARTSSLEIRANHLIK